MKNSQSVSERKAGASGEQQDTIKVVIRFKGGEKLTDTEMTKWQFDEEFKNAIHWLQHTDEMVIIDGQLSLGLNNNNH